MSCDHLLPPLPPAPAGHYLTLQRKPPVVTQTSGKDKYITCIIITRRPSQPLYFVTQSRLAHKNISDYFRSLSPDAFFKWAFEGTPFPPILPSDTGSWRTHLVKEDQSPVIHLLPGRSTESMYSLPDPFHLEMWTAIIDTVRDIFPGDHPYEHFDLMITCSYADWENRIESIRVNINLKREFQPHLSSEPPAAKTMKVARSHWLQEACATPDGGAQGSIHALGRDLVSTALLPWMVIAIASGPEAYNWSVIRDLRRLAATCKAFAGPLMMMPSVRSILRLQTGMTLSLWNKTTNVQGVSTCFGCKRTLSYSSKRLQLLKAVWAFADGKLHPLHAQCCPKGADISISFGGRGFCLYRQEKPTQPIYIQCTFNQLSSRTPTFTAHPRQFLPQCLRSSIEPKH